MAYEAVIQSHNKDHLTLTECIKHRDAFAHYDPGGELLEHELH